MQEGTQKRSVAEVFKEKRESYSAEIYDGIKLLDNIKKMTNVQVIFLSLRQRLLEENHTLLEHFTRLKKTYREKKGEEWVETSKSMQLRFNSNEKNTIVDGKTAEIKERLEQIENQIAFYAESIKTVDAVLFGLKTRVDVEKLLG
jgi:predicted nuclease with TOPRIM domain